MSDRRAASPRSSSRNGHAKLSSPGSGAAIPRAATKFLPAALHFISAPGGAVRSSPVLATAIEAAMVRPETAKGTWTMATIGTFTSSENGFSGSIRTLALNVKARIARIENPSDKGPHFRIYAGNVELGAAWQKRSNE